MEKEGCRDFFNSRDGKVSIVFLFSIVLIFVLMLWSVEAVTVKLYSPGNFTLNSSTNVNFTWTVNWQADTDTISNCTIWVNSTHSGVAWSRQKVIDIAANGTALQPDDRIMNATGTANNLSYSNFTFTSDGNFTWSVGCFNTNVSGGTLTFPTDTNNFTVYVDSLPPTITLDAPKGGVLADANSYNITSYETATFYVNVSDNSTQFVWMILNTNATVHVLTPNPGLNESVNRSMTAGTVISAPDGRRQYYFNLTPLLDFNSTFTSPGPHGVSFCANDTFDRRTCTNKSDYVIMGGNITQIENIFSTMQQGEVGSLGFGGLNITLGNGTEIPESSFMNPITGVTVGGLTHKNFTFIFNFSTNFIVHIVGGSIDESQFANASNARVNNTPTTEVRQQLGKGFNPNMVWADIGSFIPSEVSYLYGIIQIGGTGYSKKMYCNGTTMSDPQCHAIGQCNSTVFGIYNHSLAIPPNDACWLESGVINTVTLSSGFTYLFVDKFSGGLGGEDRGPPNASFIAPVASSENHRLNRSTTVTQLINFTVDDTESSGLNLTMNDSINVTITLANRVVAFFNFTNDTNTRLSCYRTDNATQSQENVTHIWCNATYSFDTNGTYTINITGRDTSNNSNPMNTTTNYFYLTVDQIPPRFDYYNFTNSSSFNTSTEGSDFELGTSPGNSRAQGDANTGIIFAVANWTDNLTQPLQARLQFYNVTAGPAWQTLNVSGALFNASNSNTSKFEPWTNFSFQVPAGHNEFEGKNISFRIIANDTVGNINSSNSVKNFTIKINDTTVPTITIPNGTLVTNGTNISDITPTISWVVTDGSYLTSINVSIDRTLPPTDGGEQGCNRAAFYSVTSSGTNEVNEFHRNGTITVKDSPGSCQLGNGTHFVNITAIDNWGNSIVFGHTFTIQTGTPTIALSSLENGFAAVNQSNVTAETGINFTATNGATGKMRNFSWTSNCASSTQVISKASSEFTAANLTFIYPFNTSLCTGVANTEANRTVTITVADDAGNSVTNLFQFFVDSKAPSLVVNISNGQTQNGNFSFNLSAKDGTLRISRLGYFLDGGDFVALNSSNISTGMGAYAENVTITRSLNFTAGTHTIKFTASDALGTVQNNTVNSSEITIVQVAGIEADEVNKSMNEYLTTLLTGPTNVTIRTKGTGGDYQDNFSTIYPDQTIEIILQLNSSQSDAINVTITELNGSAANWDNINFSVFINDSKITAGIQNNWTNTILSPGVFFNNSIQHFISDNNSYFGVVSLPFNVTNGSNVGTASAQEFWWIKNEDVLTTRTNISKCTAAFTRTTSTPCWNYTVGGRTLVFVPHFSHVVAVNDTTAPTITVNVPPSVNGNYSLSAFVPNITVSSDTESCSYTVNSSDGGARDKGMTLSGTTCLGPTEKFKNVNGVYNLTFNATDDAGNFAILVFHVNMSDATAPNSGTISSSPSETSATITISSVNETVNATVFYGTTNTSLTSGPSMQTDFNVTQSVSITSLTASTTYYYNVTVCDFAGNCKQNTTVFSFTTSAAAAAAAAAASSGGGGGGGGAVVSKVEDSKAQVWSTIPLGSSFSLDIDKATIGVTSVSVSNIKSELSNVEVEVQALKDNPVSAAAAAKVYQYLRINKKNIVDADTGKITISFRVAKTWLTENNIASGDIALYRYVDNTWIRLNTKVVSTDATYVNFEADTPGFSYFAIGSKAGGDAFAIIDAIRDFYAGTSSLSAFDIIDMIRAFYGG